MTSLILNLDGAKFDREVFIGLTNLKELDISRTLLLKGNSFFETLNVGTQLPLLRTLRLSGTGMLAPNRLVLDVMFWKFVGERPIEYLDLSYTTVRKLDLASFAKHCNFLVEINAREVHTVSKIGFWGSVRQCKRLTTIDITGITFSRHMLHSSPAYNRIPGQNYTAFNFSYITSLFNVKELFLDEVFRNSKTNPMNLNLDLGKYIKYISYMYAKCPNLIFKQI